MIHIRTSKKLLVSSFIIAICLILAIIFPTKSPLQETTKEIFFLILIPSLYVKFVLKENLTAYGLTLGDRKAGIIWGTSMFFLAIFVSYFLIRFTELKYNYNLPDFAVNNFLLFLVYELVFVNFLIIVYEYFFRGFVFFTFFRELGYKAVFIPIVIYWIMIFATDNLSWNITPAAIITFASAITVYKSRSLIYSYLSAFVYIIVFHSYLIYLLK